MTRVPGPADVPDPLQTREQWLHWDRSNDTPRRPHQGGDFAVAWSDPDKWLSFGAAVAEAEQRSSWGIGYVTAAENDDHAMGTVSVLDLDGAAQLTADGPVLCDWVPDLDPFVAQDAYIEWSPSRREPDSDRCGLHIPVVGTDIPEWFSDTQLPGDEHVGVDLLANKFCTVTGDRHADSGDELARWSDAVETWLADAVENLTGERPSGDEGGQTRLADATTDSREHDDDWPDEETAEAMLEHLNPDCGYTQWRDIGFALADHFPSATAKRLFGNWSRSGSKFDADAKKSIKDITSRGGGGVTIGTLVHHAEQGGWEPPQRDRDTGTPTPKELIARESDEYESPADVPDDVFETSESGTDTDDEEDESGDTDADDTPTWDEVRLLFSSAEDADERGQGRYQAAMKLYEDYDFATIVENDQLYVYDPKTGVYDDTGESVVRTELTQGLEAEYRSHAMSEAKDHIRGRTLVSHEDMGGPEGYIAAENCVIDLVDEQRHEHGPEYQFLSRLGTAFDPDATAPRFQQFLDEVVPSATERQKLQEFAGYSMMHWAMPHHKALFLVGPTASGKSTFLDTIRAMLGEDTITSLTPQQLTTERFSTARLFGAWANIRNDIPASTVENTGQFKEVVGGDPMKAERKRKEPFEFKPTAKHMFAANELPATDTDDEAFYRRILLVPFPETIPEPERDKHLDDKLQAELPGVLNWALEGLQRLLANGKFTGDRSPGRTQDTWDKWADSISRFEKAAITSGSSDVPKSMVYAAYLQFCREEGIPTRTQHQLTRDLKTAGYEDGRTRIKGTRQRAFRNINWTGRGKELLEAAQSDDDDDEDPGSNDTTRLSGWD